MTVKQEDVLSAVLEAEVLEDISELRTDIKLTDQGIDSLGFYNILLVLEERYGVKIPDQDIGKLDTVADIADYFNSRLGGRARGP